MAQANHLVLLLVLCLLLGACQHRPATGTSGAPSTWVAQRAFALGLSDFAIEGRVGVRQGSANIRWRQDAERYSLRLWGPLGIGTTIIEGDRRAATVTGTRLPEARTGSPEALLASVAGWSAPITALAFWVRGVPAPAADYGPASEVRFAGDDLVSFTQGGWSLSYPAFGAVAGGRLPKRVEARQGEERVTVIVRRWDLEVGVGAAEAALE